MNKLSKILIAITIFLALVIGGLIVYMSLILGEKDTLNFEIGTPFKIKAISNSSILSSVLVDGEMLPEDEIEQNISIYAPDDKDIYFRVSVYFSDREGKRTYLDVLTMPNYKKINNYYYYTNQLTKQTMTKFSNKIILPKAKDFMLFSDEIYSLNFLVETFTEKELATELWGEVF